MVKGVLEWDWDDLDQVPAEALAGSAAGVIVGVAGDPNRVDPVPSRQREE